MVKFTLAVSLVFAITLISGCGSNQVPTVHAAPPPVSAAPSSLNISCPNSEQPDEIAGNGFIELDFPSCNLLITGTSPVGGRYDFSYVLLHGVNASDFDIWVGTAQDSVFEWSYNITVTTPDGRQAKLVTARDKHTDASGDLWRNKRIPLNLPAGTRLDVTLRIGATMGVTGCNSSAPNPCGIQPVMIFNHGID